MEAMVPWDGLIALIELHYPKTSKTGGCPPYPRATMLRIYLLQQCYSLSDLDMEEALIKVPTMHRFTGTNLVSSRIPDETTTLAFLLPPGEELSRRADLCDDHHSPQCKGMSMRKGLIVDATLFAAPSSTKNMEGKRDAEMQQTKKLNQCYLRCAEGFAYVIKVHLGVDKDSGLIHSVGTTFANVLDLIPVGELLHGEEEVVYADAGYQGIAKRDEMAGKSTTFRVAMRPGKRGGLPVTPDGTVLNLIEMANAHIRAKGQYPFQVIELQFGFQKTRLRGMAKNRCKVSVLAAMTNLFLARHKFLSMA